MMSRKEKKQVLEASHRVVLMLENRTAKEIKRIVNVLTLGKMAFLRLFLYHISAHLQRPEYKATGRLKRGVGGMPRKCQT